MLRLINDQSLNTLKNEFQFNFCIGRDLHVSGWAKENLWRYKIFIYCFIHFNINLWLKKIRLQRFPIFCEMRFFQPFQMWFLIDWEIVKLFGKILQGWLRLLPIFTHFTNLTNLHSTKKNLNILNVPIKLKKNLKIKLRALIDLPIDHIEYHNCTFKKKHTNVQNVSNKNNEENIFL